MFCQNCGKQIPDDSTFCEFCGTPTGVTAGAPSAPAAPRVSLQQNESVQKAQESLKSGWNAIVKVLKDPTTTVNLGIGEMVVIAAVAIITHTIFEYGFVSGLPNFIMNTLSSIPGASSSISSLSSSMAGYGVSLSVSFIWALLTGILMPAFMVIAIVLSHCVDDKSFNNFKEYLSGAIIGCIIPSAAMLVAGLCMFFSYVLGFFFVLVAIMAFLVYLLKSFTKTNQYIIILFATVTIVVICFVAYKATTATIMDSSINAGGQSVKLSYLMEMGSSALNSYSNYGNYFGY